MPLLAFLLLGPLGEGAPTKTRPQKQKNGAAGGAGCLPLRFGGLEDAGGWGTSRCSSWAFLGAQRLKFASKVPWFKGCKERETCSSPWFFMFITPWFKDVLHVHHLCKERETFV